MELAVEIAILAAACAFSVVNGLNDGGVVVAVGLKFGLFRPWVAIALLTLVVIGLPLAFGLGVATTLARDLVSFQGDLGRLAVLSAVLSAVGVVAVFSYLRRPTSLTLALVGGIVGSGVGSGLPVAWGTIGWVVLVALAAPMTGALCAWVLSSVLARVRGRRGVFRTLRDMHAVAFLLVCVAYAANDGQKMFAVFAVAAGASIDPLRADPGTAVLVGLLFGLGAMLGTRRFAGLMGSGLLLSRPFFAVTSEYSAAAAVLGSAGLGAPVSMTQCLSGALIGAGARSGVKRVRWHVAARLARAGVATLPAAAAAGVSLSALLARGSW